MKVNCIHPKKYDTYKINKQDKNYTRQPNSLQPVNSVNRSDSYSSATSM